MKRQPLPIGRRPARQAGRPAQEKASDWGCSLGLGPENLWIKRDDLSGLRGGQQGAQAELCFCGAALADGSLHLA